MIKGIYTSSAAMRTGIARQDVIANNLANANTTGFKRDRLFVEKMITAEAALNAGNPAATVGSRYVEMTPGAFEPTGNGLDFAIQGNGFFVLSDGTNEVYTRNGRFERDAEGLLVDPLGRKVMGEGGEITLPPGTVTVDARGNLSVDGAVIDRFRVVGFEDPQTLQKDAGGAFTKTDQTGAESVVEDAVVRQGFLETSNVNTVQEMVEMISTARSFDMNARLVRAQDDSLRQSVNELGKV